MVRFEGARHFVQHSEELWSRLTDPTFLVTCLPDLERIERVDGNGAAFLLRPGFSFVRGTLQAQMTIVDKVPHQSATYRLEARGIGSSSTVEVVLMFGEEGQGTLLRYTAQVAKLTGLLKMVPSGLITGAAQKVVADVLASVEKNLAPES